MTASHGALAEDELADGELNARYRTAVEGLLFGTFDRTAKGAYMYELAKRAAALSGGSRVRQKRIAKELRGMQVAGGLPSDATAAIFVRHDEDRLDVVRLSLARARLRPLQSLPRNAGRQPVADPSGHATRLRAVF